MLLVMHTHIKTTDAALGHNINGTTTADTADIDADAGGFVAQLAQAPGGLAMAATAFLP
ncbi:MAG: hypothetical protein AAFN68_14195 [Pseudomonadota bacterium]